MGRTLAEKVWDDARRPPRRGRAGPALHRPPPGPRGDQPAGLRRAAARRPPGTPSRPDPRHRGPQRPDRSTSTSRSPTRSRAPRSRRCARNAAEFGVRLHPLGDVEQGIVHVVGPQLGLTQPGMTIVCGDSHTSTHGAFGALAFGIGTSEVEHVLATQTLPQARPKTMAVTVNGALPDGRHRQGPGPRADRADRHRRRPGLHRRVPRPGHRGALDGGPDDGLQHVHRVGRQGRHDRAGRDHLRLPRGPAATRRRAPTGTPRSRTGRRCAPTTTPSSTRRSCSTPPTLTPFVTWGTNPGQGAAADRRRCPDPADFADEHERSAAEKALEYMGLQAGHADARHQGRHRLPRLLHQRPDRGPARRRRGRSRAAGRRRRAAARRPRLGAGAARRPRTRASTWSSRRPAPSGGTPAARCAWA